MGKPDLIVCIPDMYRIPPEHQDEARRVQATLIDYSGKGKNKHNERMGHEEKVDPDFIDPQFPLAATHQRMGPWLIDDLTQDVYVSDESDPILGGEFNEVHVFYFHYSPLPEAVNPWVRIEPHDLSELPDHAKEAMGLSAMEVG